MQAWRNTGLIIAGVVCLLETPTQSAQPRPIEISPNAEGGITFRTPFIEIETQGRRDRVRPRRRNRKNLPSVPLNGTPEALQPRLEPTTQQPTLAQPTSELESVLVELPQDTTILYPITSSTATPAPTANPATTPERIPSPAPLPAVPGAEAPELGEPAPFPNDSEESERTLSGPVFPGETRVVTKKVTPISNLQSKRPSHAVPFVVLIQSETAKLPQFKARFKSPSNSKLLNDPQVELTPITHQEFVRLLKETSAGVYLTALRHPVSQQPVCLPIRLPEGKPAQTVTETELTLKFSEEVITIQFRPDGQVAVRYDD